VPQALSKGHGVLCLGKWSNSFGICKVQGISGVGGKHRGDAKKGRAEIYKSKVALNFSLLDVVARITTRTMSIAGEMRLEMAA